MDSRDEFLDYLDLHGRRPLTIKSYRGAIDNCRRLPGFPREPEDITPEDVMRIYDNDSWSYGTRQTYANVVGHFAEWRTGKNPRKDLDYLWSRSEPRRTWIDPDDMRTLWSHASERDRVILALGGFMGLRRTEIADVRWSDIDGRTLVVRGKGHGTEGKVSMLRIPPLVRDVLDGWRTTRGAEGLPDYDPDAVVVTTYNRQVHRISPDGVGHAVSRLFDECGIEGSTHTLRRFFANHLLASGVDLTDIRLLMRHDNIQTTVRCYIEPSPARLDAIMESVGEFYII